MNEIYSLDNGETMVYDGGRLHVMRVPGGWLYEKRSRFLFWKRITIEFVPFDEEFYNVEKPKKIGYEIKKRP